MPEIEDAWFWDHLLPVAGPKEGQAQESRTLLAAPPAQTGGLPLGVLSRNVFDFEGRYHRLTGIRCEPQPVQGPGPPLLIGGWGTRLLLLARHGMSW